MAPFVKMVLLKKGKIPIVKESQSKFFVIRFFEKGEEKMQQNLNNIELI